jgi:hypothetical protein
MIRKDYLARQMVEDGKFWKSGHESAHTRNFEGGSMSCVIYMGGWRAEAQMADLEYMLPGSLTSLNNCVRLKYDVFYGLCRVRIISLLVAGSRYGGRIE